LPTEQEVTEMITQSKQQQAQASQQPNPDAQKKMADAQLALARAQEIVADINGNDAKRQLEGMALMGQHKARAF
jgi:hypothetical protein